MPKLLLVDDNEMNCDILVRLLKRRGYEASVAHDGATGLSMAQSQSPDVILMDLNLPDMDGAEATRRLKADAATNAVPIIALTAHAMEGDRERALSEGFDDYDTKPVDITRLLGKIEGVLSHLASADSGV